MDDINGSISVLQGKQKRVLLHFGFWFFYVLFFGSVYGKYGNNFTWYYLESLCMLPFIALATYTTIYILLPFYLKTRKLLITLFLVTVLIFVVTLGERISLRMLNGLPIGGESLFGVTFLYLMLETNFMVGIAFIVKMMKYGLKQQEEKHMMETRNLQTELTQLKTQLHPHFLFNTMNNLYALSIEQSSKTSESIARFSELLRSVLYECNETEIELEKEIALVCNYIDLEKIRFGSRLQVEFEISGETSNFKIAPMLLFTFVENCFKHGASPDPATPSIKIVLKTEGKAFYFMTENSKPLAENTLPKTGGIGLKNVQKRLDLIYGSNYLLKISDNYHNYIVELKIQQPDGKVFIQ